MTTSIHDEPGVWSVELKELIRRFEAERATAGSDFAAARTVIEAAEGERFDESLLVTYATGVIEDLQGAPEVELSPSGRRRLRSRRFDTSKRESWADLPRSDQVAIFAVGLVEWAKEDAEMDRPGAWPLELDELATRLSSQQSVVGSEYAAARAVIDAAQGERFDERVLVAYACEAFEEGSEPPEVELSPHAEQLMRSGQLDWRIGEPWEDLSRADQLAIFAAGLVARVHDPNTPWDPLNAPDPSALEGMPHDYFASLREIPDLPPTTDYRVWSREQYVFWFYGDRQGEGCLDLLAGWVPGGIAGLLVGLIAGFTTGRWWLLPAIALASAVLGYIATGLGHVLLQRVDVDWLRLGPNEHTAWGVVYFGTGPVIALLIGALVL